MQPHWRALALLTIARTSLGFQFQSVASVSPLLVEQMGLTYPDLGTLIGLYFAPGLVIALPGGALGQRFGDKRMVVFGLLLMAVGGIAPPGMPLGHGRARTRRPCHGIVVVLGGLGRVAAMRHRAARPLVIRSGHGRCAIPIEAP